MLEAAEKLSAIRQRDDAYTKEAAYTEDWFCRTNSQAPAYLRSSRARVRRKGKTIEEPNHALRLSLSRSDARMIARSLV
jgi:hypothetical protein